MFDRDELMIDLKGAARLGSAEALDMALEGLKAWRALAANARLDEEAIVKKLVPLGEVLATPTVPRQYLLSLAKHPLAGYRALAGVALTLRVLKGEAPLKAALTQLAGDQRAEVRLAVATALGKHGASHFPPARDLLRAWLRPAQSPRVWNTALQAIAALAPTHPQELLAIVEKLPPRQITHPDMMRPLAEAMKRIAAFSTPQGQEEVLSVLAQWVQNEHTAVELALRVLHAEWARKIPDRALGFLDALEGFGGPRRLLRRTQAFIRQGFPSGEKEW